MLLGCLQVFTASPMIDHHPLKMNPYNYLKKGRMIDDVFRLKQIDRENKELLKRINIINRKGVSNMLLKPYIFMCIPK